MKPIRSKTYKCIKSCIKFLEKTTYGINMFPSPSEDWQQWNPMDHEGQQWGCDVTDSMPTGSL